MPILSQKNGNEATWDEKGEALLDTHTVVEQREGGRGDGLLNDLKPVGRLGNINHSIMRRLVNLPLFESNL